MSIALVAEVYDEARRLAIAGSVVAPGDFRIKKLIAPLEQVGAKAPVFAKVAEAVKAVVDANDKTSAQTLLDLTTLVSAILYTQGETGVAGELQPIETTDLGLVATQTGARLLKPLLEALSTKGSGRLEVIRDAYERGAFHDLRLIQPAAAAIDDAYPEIADLICDKILPLYGQAILPALRASFDMKGRAGHPRRLRFLHQLDPAGSRELVKRALEEGSKEVKVAAIECLGWERDDISYLLEQASAKAQEVRQAAYRALAQHEDDAVIAVLQKAFDGKDLAVAADALRRSRSEKLLRFVRSRALEELAELPKTKEKKDTSTKVARLTQMLECLRGRVDPASEELVLKVFGDRAALAKIRGATLSGADLNSAVVSLLAEGTPTMVAALVKNHAELDSRDLAVCFAAAQRSLPADQVYKLFSPYLSSTGDRKRADKHSAIANQIRPHDGRWGHAESSALDARWLDRAVAIRDIDLVGRLIRPGHAAANWFLSEAFKERIKSAKHVSDCQGIVAAMARAEHPEATDAAIALIEKFNDKTGYFGYYLGHFIVDLPKSSLPRLEALIPKLHDRVADVLLVYLQQLREKP
jgi:HEAT repeats